MQKPFKFFGGEMNGQVRLVHKMDRVLYQPQKPLEITYIEDDVPKTTKLPEPQVYFLRRIYGSNREFLFYLHEAVSIDELLEEIFT